MPKNPPQKFKVAAVPKVAHRKRVAKRVRGEADAGNAALLPEYLEIPLKVPYGQGRIVFCPKYESGSSTTEMAKQALAKLDREGYKSVFTAFAQHL
jgi:hypothetical protein